MASPISRRISPLSRHHTGRAFAELDLIISVDIGAAHLAGALNRPVWVLLV